MIKINGEDYTIEQIESVFHLTQELLQINETLNANIIAFDAKLKNEEKKVKDLQYKLFFLTQQTINNYEA
jgi:hypothetical protein